ncbi:MAG: PHA/PHB synthase family protein, partial [Pseudomonadales bacterium]
MNSSANTLSRASDMGSEQDDIQHVIWERPEPTVALNPQTGFQLEDLMTAAGKVALQGARQPLIFNKHMASHGRKLVEILANSADYTPHERDNRFQDTAWKANGVYQRLLQSYLATNESLEEWVNDLNLNSVDRLRAEFLLRIIGDSFAPTNTLLGNPKALRKAWQTRGMSLLKGLRNLIDDVRNNHGIPAQVKGEAFQVGENLATTPGAVVFRNDVLELIQYTPTTGQVFRRPLLMVSAMINKFYAFDLTPDRSMIKFCLDHGMQVFVVSWANPGREQADWGIEKYAMAVREAITAIKSITRSKDLNLLALCSGAMATSVMAAYLKAQGDHSIHSMTIGVCMLDMQQTDMEMSAFSTDEVRAKAKERSRKASVLRGHELALSMLWLRPNDLIWSNVVNNYLLGNDPPEFDLLYWNNDWTNLPAQLHANVIDMFATGRLMQPGEMNMAGTALD